ncbi:CIPK25 [Symbiodinium sp. CCMP2456]|nr:CIPK25 [Symbiodinium sp. CCMP2456]
MEIAGRCGRIKCIFTDEPEGLRHKFTTKCDGEWVDVRGAPGRQEWIGRDADETSCWACNTLPVDTVSRRRKVGAFVNHHEEGLGQVIGPAENQMRVMYL